MSRTNTKYLSRTSSVKFCSNFLTILLVLAGLAGGVARAQEFRGTISGAIADPTGAVVAGASVTVKETQTGTVNRTVSDNSGQYVVPFLLPGEYSITASAAGFQTITRAGITLQSQEHPIINLKLTIGEASQTVNVTAEAPLVDQANASVGQVISTESVADLPLNGRTPAVLTELSMGVISEIPPQLVHPFDNSAGNSWSLGGTPNQASESLLDGSPDLTILGQLAFSPSQDTVQEVSVRPFDTDSSFGHTIGGVVNQITKTGTNRLHGTAYEFNQIPNLDANSYLNDRAVPVVPLPVTHYNQWGFTVGGPIVIPKVYNGKDKLFFFFAYEGLKDSQPVTTTLTVPTISGGLTATTGEVNGDFYQTLVAGCPTGFNSNLAATGAICNADPALGSAYKNPYADPNQLYNPYSATTGSSFTRSPILNNQLTSVWGTGGINSVAAAYLKLYPAPNNTANAAPNGLGNYISNAPSADKFNSEFGRMDYNVNSRDHIFFDMRHNNRTQTKNNYFSNNSIGSELLRENFGATLDNVYTLNSTTIIDTRFNWTYFDEVHAALAQAYSANTVGLPAALTTSSEMPVLPCMLFGTSSSQSSCGSASTTTFQSLGDNNGSSIDPTTSYQAFVDVVKLIGRHTLKIGFDGRRYQLRYASYGNSSGGFTFGPQFTSLGSGKSNPGFGGDLADLEFGQPTAGEYDINAQAAFRGYYVGTFVQDDWRVNDQFTLNLGLRFDIDTPFGEQLGRTVNGFNPTATNTASGSQLAAAESVTGGTSTYTVSSVNSLGGLTFPNANYGAPYQTNSGFFSPRIGFSYSPAMFSNKTVFRGGFGIFVQPETVSQLNGVTGVVSSSAYVNQEGYSQSTTFVAANNSSFQTPVTNPLSNPFPNGFLQPAGSSAGASTFLGQGITFLAPVQHDPYSERWDIGIQQAVTPSTMLEVLYVGNHGVHLPVNTQNLNAIGRQYLTTNPYRDQDMATAYAKTVANPFVGKLPNSSGCNSSTTTFSNLLVPYPQFCNAAVTEQNQTIGQSYFDSAIIHLEQRSKHGLTLTANYSFSKLIEADVFLNQQDTAVTRQISPEDHVHHFTVGGTYKLPFGKGKMFAFGGSRLWDEILGGFVVNGVYQFQTGAPLQFSADIPLAPGATLRSITNQPRNTNPVTTTYSGGLNAAAFVTGSASSCTAGTVCDGSVNINGQYSNHYRTLPYTMSWVRSDGYNNLDASILKNFNFTGGAYLQLRFETFNTLNHPVFAPANTSTTSGAGGASASNFGYNTTGTIANSLPRQVQLGARIVF
jgi:hypothetical protein